MILFLVYSCIYVQTLQASVTRRDNFKLVPQHCKYDLRKCYFTNRVVPIWNSLPNDVVMVDNINLFNVWINSGR